LKTVLWDYKHLAIGLTSKVGTLVPWPIKLGFDRKF